MDEFEIEMAQLVEDGIKSNPLRLTYEAEVRALSSMPDQLRAEGYSEEQIARVMHNRRRELGRQFKEAAPPLFREYITLQLPQNTEIRWGRPLRC